MLQDRCVTADSAAATLLSPTDQRVEVTELHTDTCECQKCCDVTTSVCVTVNVTELVSCVKLEYF
jgi:hypothetical protein